MTGRITQPLGGGLKIEVDGENFMVDKEDIERLHQKAGAPIRLYSGEIVGSMKISDNPNHLEMVYRISVPGTLLVVNRISIAMLLTGRAISTVAIELDEGALIIKE